ncbi:MAG: ABC transporter ATP-binding protein [Acidobacteria bacterium]|nr:ABC transporter ATP-binding protein [Acidobacteriota bacterium]
MLSVSHLNKSFSTEGGDVHAVRDVSFSAANGEVVAIVGASGSGKSTLLSLLGLLDAPDSGSIDIDGTQLAHLDATGRTKYRASDVGFVFQSFNLIPNLSALENVLLALEFAQWPKESRESRAREMLEMVGLNDQKAQRRPAKLSGGEQQRVAIARAFAANPKLILADEPTGSLDRSTGQKIVTLLRQAAATRGTTVLVVTHDDKVAQQADRRFEIEDGVLSELA